MDSRSPAVPIEGLILLLRGQRVMLDVDLALIYGVSTGRLNEQVRRNRRRFPADFMFQLTSEEKAEVIANCDNLRGLKFFPRPPSAFTEQGALMLASVLNSSTAIRASVGVVRAFVRLRRLLAADKDLAARLEALERKYDAQFKEVFDAIRGLMAPPKEPPRRIGFKPG